LSSATSIAQPTRHTEPAVAIKNVAAARRRRCRKAKQLCFALTDNEDLPLLRANMKALSCFVGLA
jgi:hypothetical protein